MIRINWLKKHFYYLSCFLLTACGANLSHVQHDYAPVHKGFIEYYAVGHGDPIVLIPGYVTDVSSWNRDFLAELATQHQLIILNNRNVGGSFVAAHSYQMQDLANDTHQLMRDLHLQKSAVLGISMGGMIAQQLAISYPQSISKLILINTAIAGKQAVHPAPDVENDLMNMPTDKIGRYKTAVKLFFPDQWKPRMAVSLAVDRFQPNQYIEINPIAVKSQQKCLITQWVRDNDAANKLATLDMPVLILNGGADIVLPPKNSEILARTIPHAKLVRWQEGGHAMIYQYPKQIADVINQFLR